MRRAWKRKPVTEQGMLIYNIRKTYELTQKQLADILGTTQSTVSNWETGRTVKMHPLLWKAICKNFDLERVRNGK